MDTPHRPACDGPDMYFRQWPTRARYPVNTTLHIREHAPPPPFGHYGDNPRPPPDLSRWEGKGWWELDRFDLALADPPLETTSPGPVQRRTLTVTGIKTLRTDGGGAHVVTCFLDGDRATEYVAKIYDGADYPLGTDRRDTYPDFMTRADQDYCIEAAAYQTMHPRIGGKGIVPAYHGAWTFSMGRSGPGLEAAEECRWVRMILMEYIHGDCMLTIMVNAKDRDSNPDYAPLPPEPFRLRVLQHVLEVFEFAWWYGMVRHMDYAPRNFMVRPDATVVLIDFNDSLSEELAAGGGGSHPRFADPAMLPPSPIQQSLQSVRSMVKRISPWYCWIPEGWRGDNDKIQEWLIDTFRDDARFAPLDDNWLNSSLHQKWCSDKILRLLESLGRKPAEGVEAEQTATP